MNFLRKAVIAANWTVFCSLVFLAACNSNSHSFSASGPTITAQPTDQTVTVGSKATFSVTATGTSALSYQWQKGGQNIANATSSAYTTPATVQSDNGTKFDVVVTDATGSTTSNTATLTVNPALVSIAVGPPGPSIAKGQTQSFTATGTYSDTSTKDITTSVTWKSSNTNAATISNAAGSNGQAFGAGIGTSNITASLGSVTSTIDVLTVTAPKLVSIQVTPPNPTITQGQTQQFAATGTYTDASQATITTSVTWNSSNTAAATISTQGLATSAGTGSTFITATLSGITSPQDTLTVNAVVANTVDVPTYHYDNARGGVNSSETILTPAIVGSTATFGKLGEFTVDGQIDGQALYLSQLSINGALKNVLYVATENDTVYALDADSFSGTSATVLWQKSVAQTGETAVPGGNLPCGAGNLGPTVGVIATPVIDRARNTIYVVAQTQNAGGGNILWRLHALDLTNGNELFGGPTTITATYPGTGGNSSGGVVTFLPSVQHDRAALLESNGIIYTAWSGLYGDCGQYSGWVISYDAGTLTQKSAMDLVPNDYRAGIWMGGGGPAADSSGDVYVISGNTLDTGSYLPGTSGYYGNSFVRLSGSGTLSAVDYFTPFNTVTLDSGDVDFGSTSPLILPDLTDATGGTVHHLAIGSGKDGYMYVVDRDNMGHFNTSANNIYQQIRVSSNEVQAPAIFFNGTVYVAGLGSQEKAYPVSLNPAVTVSSTASSVTTAAFSNPVPTISANGTANAILWCLDYGANELFAYDATNLGTMLYNSNQATGSRDHFSSVGGHFITPMVANGKVYFGTGTSIVAFGKL